MENLLKRSYQSIVNRGLITDKTTLEDFNDKILEEFEEMQFEFEQGNLELYIHEGFDLINVFLNFCIHNNIDIKKRLEEIIIKNELRAIKNQ